MRKIALRRVPNDLTENKKCLRYDAARTHLESYECEGEAFYGRLLLLRPGPELMNHSWNANQMSGIVKGHRKK